jgi:NAD(P)-dependent dehydrogenase (short-subunit alcohol dehydrogenase family)
MQISGASAIVTGAGRGIGRAVALALAREGAAVTAFARTQGELETLVAEIRQAGGRAIACAGDVRERAACERAVTAARQAHGRVQILVNNAGIGIHKPFAEMTDEDWQTTLDTNLTGVFYLTRAALSDLTSGGGHVFMISSLAGANPIAGLAAYCASKAALDHLAACLMLEVRHQGVKISVLAPGSVDTDFGSLPRGDGSWMLKPEDLAEAIVDLLRTRHGAHLSRIEMRPAQPQKRG